MLDVPFLTEVPFVVHGIFDKNLGNISRSWGSQRAVGKARRKLARKFPGMRLVEAHQTHSSRLKLVRKSSKTDSGLADGLFTQTPGLLLMLKTADCLPLFFVDPVKEAIGLVHVGWRGAEKRVHVKALTFMQKHFGSRPKDVLVAMGPGICRHCYTWNKFPSQLHDRGWQQFIDKKDNQWHIDLRGFVMKGLKGMGVAERHLQASTICTVESKQFFSHRRSRATSEVEGRCASVIGIKTSHETKKH